MASDQDLLPLYLHLARASERRRQPLVSDKFLVLAGVAAAEQGLDGVAANCRARILSHNPGHLVRRYPTVAAALADTRFQGFFQQVARQYTRERVEHIGQSLGIDLAGERATYYSLDEYATAILGPPLAAQGSVTPRLDAVDVMTGDGLDPDGDVHETGAPTRSAQPAQSGSEMRGGFAGNARVWPGCLRRPVAIGAAGALALGAALAYFFSRR